VDRLIMPTLDALRPLPASAFILVAILILGLNESMSIVVITFGSLWSVAQHRAWFPNVPVGLREVVWVLEMRPMRNAPTAVPTSMRRS
jgi:sulfonate transport system permease protein